MSQFRFVSRRLGLPEPDEEQRGHGRGPRPGENKRLLFSFRTQPRKPGVSGEIAAGALFPRLPLPASRSFLVLRSFISTLIPFLSLSPSPHHFATGEGRFHALRASHGFASSRPGVG